MVLKFYSMSSEEEKKGKDKTRNQCESLKPS